MIDREIDYYINRGYTCIGFDCRGCKLSDGKITHFGASIQDLTALYNYLEEINFLQEKPLFLWGHSWGGYTALAGSTLPKVKKIIAFAPFDKPLKIIFSQSKKIIKGLANFLIPFRFVYYGLRYGKFFNISIGISVLAGLKSLTTSVIMKSLVASLEIELKPLSGERFDVGEESVKRFEADLCEIDDCIEFNCSRVF